MIKCEDNPKAASVPELLANEATSQTVTGTWESEPPGRGSPFAARWQHRCAHRLHISDSHRFTVVFALTGNDAAAEFFTHDWRIAAGAGYTVLIPPGARGLWCARGPMEYVSICFPVLFAFSLGSIPPFCRADDRTLHQIGQVIAAALVAAEPAQPWELPAWSTVLGSHLIRRYGSSDSHRRNIVARERSIIPATIAYIDRNLQAPLKIIDLAGRAGMSRSRFTARFKRWTGVSPHRFILTRRLCKARGLLANSDVGLADVAQEVGFCSQSHMTRAFRDAIGVTPYEFRKRQSAAAAFQDRESITGAV